MIPSGNTCTRRYRQEDNAPRSFRKKQYACAIYSCICIAYFVLFNHSNANKARRRLSEAQKWKNVGMHSAGMSFKAIGRQLGCQHTVVSRLIRKHCQTNNVKDQPRSGRARVTSQREDRALVRLVRRQPFSMSTRLLPQWLPHRRLSLKTLRNRLRAAGLASRRVIKRPLLTDEHKRIRLLWCLARRGWNLRTWRRIHWSDESRLLLHVTDGRIRVRRHKGTAYTPRNIKATVPNGGGSVMV